MLDYEFLKKPSTATNTEAIEKKEKNSYLDFIEENDYFDNKCFKKKKACKKQKKKLKKLSSKYKALAKELSAIKSDIKKLKKAAHSSKFEDLINCDSLAERKKLAAELRKMEV